MCRTRFHIYEIILVAMLNAIIEHYVKITFEHIEPFLHIGVDMGKCHLTGSEVGNGYLREVASRLLTVEKDALLTYGMGGDDGLNVF